MNILFVSSSAKDVPVLYIPRYGYYNFHLIFLHSLIQLPEFTFFYDQSVVFITLPIGLNVMLAFYIITHENKRPEFFKWLTTNVKVASIFTVLSGADIEALNVLQSNLAGFTFFRAPFSDESKSKIFWGACLNIFIEDIPQVIIQVRIFFITNESL